MPAVSEQECLTWLRRVAEKMGTFEIEHKEMIPQVALEGGRVRADALITLRRTDTHETVKLAVDGRSRLTPGEASAIAREWQNVTWDRGLLICCPYISPRTAEICRNAGINYLDKAGNCRIVATGFYVEIMGHPNPAPDTRPLMNPFAQKGSRIVRVLLENPNRSWQVQEIAKEANVSNGLVSKSKRVLVDEGYVHEPAGRISLCDPKGLLRAWSEAYKSSIESVGLYVMDDLNIVESKLNNYCEEKNTKYAFAGFTSAWSMAPMVRVNRTIILIQRRPEGNIIQELIAATQAKHVESGANLTVWITQDEWMFYKSRTVEGKRVTSPIQTYLDLSGKAGRGEEAARAVYERRIEPEFDQIYNRAQNRVQE